MPPTLSWLLACRPWPGQIVSGMGGIDWAGLPIVAAHLGITDVEGLMHRLYVLRTYTPAAPAKG